MARMKDGPYAALMTVGKESPETYFE